ncbi:MAG: hypothetical protein ACLPS1_13005 [Streptosporangiaceae bacterium]|jgi:hypothetical protein
MAGERGTGRRRARGSWTLRIAGIAVVVLLAAGGATAYLLSSRPADSAGAERLPSRVTSVQTVGLVVQPPATGGGALRQLVQGPAGLAFSPVSPAAQAAGNPVWTADLMVGGSYVFIYIPDGRCLAASGRQPGWALSLQHCNLGPDQRWHELSATVKAGGRVFGQFRDMGSGECLSAASGAAGPAGLARCDPAQPWDQLVAFW